MEKKVPEGNIRPTGWRMPLGVIVISGILAFIIVGQAYAALPILPWTAVPTLVLLALGESITAVHTQRRIRRKPGSEPIEPLSAARLVAFAKASAMLGALVIGIFGGMGLTLVGKLDIPAPRADAWTSLGTVLAGALLLAAALFLEYACRVPDDEESEDSSPSE